MSECRKNEIAMKTPTTHLLALLGLVVIGLSACSPNRYAVSPDYENDELYYTPGTAFVGEQAASSGAVSAQSAQAAPEDDYYDPNRSGFVPNQNLMFGDPNMRSNNFGPSINVGFNMSHGRGFARPWGGRNMMPSSYFMGHSPFGFPMWSSGVGMGMGTGFGMGMGNGMGGMMCDPFYDPFFSPWNSPFNTPYNSAFYDPYWGMPGMGWGGMWGNPWNNGWGNSWGNGWNNGWGNPWNNPWNNGWGWGGDSAGNNTVYGNRTPMGTTTPGGSSYGTGGTMNNPRTDYFLGEQPESPSGRPVGTTTPIGTSRGGTQNGVRPIGSTRDTDYFPTTRPLADPPTNRTNTGGSSPAATPSRTTPPSRSNNSIWDNLQRNNDGGSTSPSRGGSSPSRSGGSTSPSRSSGGSSPSVSPSRSTSSPSTSPSRSTSPPSRSGSGSNRSPR